MNVNDDMERIIKGEKGGESRSPKSKSKKKANTFFTMWDKNGLYWEEQYLS